MKKLLSLLTILTLTASIPAPLMANTVQTRVKRDIRTTNSNNDNILIKMNGIDRQNNCIIKDENNNFYFGTDNGLYKLSIGSNTPIKINGLNEAVYSISIDKSNTIYLGTDNGAFVLKQCSTTPIPINGITGNIYSLAVDKNDNVYIATVGNGLYKLTAGSTTLIPIKGINKWINFVFIDKSNNVYIGTIGGLYKLTSGSTSPTKINDVNTLEMVFDSKYNILFSTSDGIYKLTSGSTAPTKINGVNENVVHLSVDSDNNIYFTTRNNGNDIMVLNYGNNISKKIVSTSSWINSIIINNKNELYFGTSKGAFILQTALSWTKQQSQFNLVDSSKSQTWTSPYLLSVDGELNIEITDPNIDKVLFDNVQQGQTNKKWTINIKPEIEPKDHNLQVIFTLDGKQYKSEIIVSIQAKIDPPTPSKQENLNDVIKFDDDNNLGNILDNNNETIISTIGQKNSRIIDFSQIEIEKKDMQSATLTAKKDSKSYQGSVVVKYNVVPATVVDLKIDLVPTSSTAQVDIDYLGQIDTSNIINPVNTFYYANSESVITMVKPTPISMITGVVYGCDDKWNKTSQPYTIDPKNGIKLDWSQLATKNGRYVIELSDNLGHSNNIYLQIDPKQAIAKYFDIDNGKQFEIWAKANGHDNIRGYSASQLNKLFKESQSWIKQASNNQLANAIADLFKNKGKLASKQVISKEQIIEQLKHQTPNTITINKFDTSNYDLNKVSFEIKGMQFQPNEKVEIVIKYGSEKSNSFILQIKNYNPPNNNTKGLTGWTIVGIIAGSLSGLLLLGWLFKKFVITPFILEPIRKKKAKAFAEKTEKDISQMKKDDEEWETKQKEDK